MARSILLMISNNNQSLRELYSVVLANDLPGWRTSYMTAMPERELEIMAGYDLIIYELGKADDPNRIDLVRSLGDRLREATGAALYTHLEGFLPQDVVADLAAHNVRAATGPVSWQGLAADLKDLAAGLARPAATPPREGGRLLGRLGRLLHRGEPREGQDRQPPPGETTP